MRLTATFAALTIGFAATAANATGMATCDSGPVSGWRPEAELVQKISSMGWKIRRIKPDGGCYEVYAFDKDGKRIEAYFHPLTLEVVPTARYP